MALASSFGKNAVFLFPLCLDSHIVLRHAIKHIFAFADIYDFIIDLDAVDSRVFVFRRKPLAL